MRKIDEKRSYYRINDIVGLKYSRIEEGDNNASVPAAAQTPLTEELATIDHELNQLTNSLWLENPLLAQALGLLNRKLTLFAAHALPHEQLTPTDQYQEILVSISGSGMGFNTGEQFDQGDRLSLMLALKPSNIDLRLTGVVAGCELMAKTQGYWVRVNFEPGNEAAQEQLIQHIVQRQCAQTSEQPGDSKRA